MKVSKLLGRGICQKYDIIVALETACIAMSTHCVCGEFEAESCGSVKTMAQTGRRGQNHLAMVFGKDMTTLLP